MPVTPVIAAISQQGYVTAASSLALVVGTLAFVAGGSLLAAHRAAQEDISSIQPPQKRPRIKPLQAKEQLLAGQPPPKAEAVDEAQQQ